MPGVQSVMMVFTFLVRNIAAKRSSSGQIFLIVICPVRGALPHTGWQWGA
jgi:hypothetical protein